MPDALKYRLEDDVPLKENILFTAQHFVFFIASSVVIPVIVGYAFGLAQAEVSSLMQRTLFLCGLVSFLQTAFGHRFPIIDAPAGLWTGLFILMAANIETFGNDYALLRTNLETGMMIAGGVVLILVFSGVIRRVLKLFTPIVNGVLILLMVLQIAPSIVKGMTGIDATNPYVDGASVSVFCTTMLSILLISAHAKGFNELRPQQAAGYQSIVLINYNAASCVEFDPKRN